jgi:hypothetical protein
MCKGDDETVLSAQVTAPDSTGSGPPPDIMIIAAAADEFEQIGKLVESGGARRGSVQFNVSETSDWGHVFDTPPVGKDLEKFVEAKLFELSVGIAGSLRMPGEFKMDMLILGQRCDKGP